MFQVVKRDGEVDEFKIGKITAAIHKAFDAKEKNYSEEMIDLLDHSHEFPLSFIIIRC